VTLFGAPRSIVERALPRRETVDCPVCRVPPVTFAVDAQGFHLARCPRCGLQFHSPRPPLADLAGAVYAAAYHQPAEAVAEPTQRNHFERQIARVERLRGRAGGTLLDVGCGAGAFLRFAHARGWAVAGTDYVVSPLVRDARLRVYEGELAQIEFPAGLSAFDFIRFNQVLEHTADPVLELRTARGLLSHDGIVLVSVPNLGGVSARIKSLQSRYHLKRHAWRHYAAVHHLWFFTPPTLRRTMEAAGLQPLAWETPFTGTGRPARLRALYAAALEGTRLGSILDVYARPRLP
jgi:2-polyprenyl-3-methyl-5-hydroxy-6-metoxy-1,4-benzoquinol methylase